MAKIAEMTQLSPTMSEGTIVNWIKKEGDSVSPGEVMAEVETDKAVMEMESYESGVLLAIIAGPGTKVAVGLPVAIIGQKDEDIKELLAEAKKKIPTTNSGSQEKKKEAEPAQAKVEKTSAEKPTESKSEQKSDDKQIEKPEKQELAKKSSNAQNEALHTGRILASPLAKAVAIQKSVDLKYVSGTGPDGRILEKDVYSYLENNQGNKTVTHGQIKEDVSIPVSGMRKVIAQRLSSSKQNLPHFYLNIEIDADPLTRYREILNSSLEKMHQNDGTEGKAPKLSFNDLIVKAVALALNKHPNVNASWKGDQIVRFGNIDIGIAVSLDEGLITPVIRSANFLSLTQISSETRELANRARNRKLKPEEYTGSTFTISNLGMYGIQFFTAIINEPESAILAVGAIEEKAVVRSGEVVPGKTLQLTLSCDHRAVDGAEGAKFLVSLKTFLEAPELFAS
ncbi:pyruvate dehydrogenase complex dihydrolipoamide acetyltransferase [Leptospira sp. GIMC2001]|uniref:pyruvate dehydrogenase complex dihydrolipoamide acetyltransferase n=1 Tax=Leptospira sp. GIMC2001 TaxID=1513297 RepID=UPI00234B7C38|nr:pyruvate dehydrogenase complex dihydrolipoamide acetyltransferase [Leptospira sp. GIMC2001]WCL48070.1 pyruvate dehydrogenase complex dihydrolipoamide acetyltransferase [Leptospira sp. GIMC2001]